MIEMLKNFLAKTRKSRTNAKSPAKHVRSFTPNRTPKGEIDLAPRRGSVGRSEIPIKSQIANKKSEIDLKFRKSSVERFESLSKKSFSNGVGKRSYTPQFSDRSNSEKSLPLDFRKLVKEKVDKKVKEKLGELEKEIYKKWNEIGKVEVKDLAFEKEEWNSKELKGMVENRLKDMYPRLRDFVNKSVEVIKQHKPQYPAKNIGKSTEKPDSHLEELVNDTLSKAQYRSTNLVEKSIENNTLSYLKKSHTSAKQVIVTEVQNLIFSAIGELKSKVPYMIEESISLNVPLEKTYFAHKAKSDFLQHPSTNKPFAKLSSATSLKEFLQYEKTAKATK